MKSITLLPKARNLPGDILRAMIVAVMIEVIRHYLKPKDRTIQAIDYTVGIDSFDNYQD